MGCTDEWSVALTTKLVASIKKVIKEIEREQPTSCNICGYITVYIESENRKGDKPVQRMVGMSRDTWFINPYTFATNPELRGQKFHYPLGYNNQVVSVSVTICVKDRKDAIDNSDYLVYEISRRLIRTMIAKLENNIFADCSFYDHRLAMVETAKEIIREHSDIPLESDGFVKLGRDFGFRGVIFDVLFKNEAYNYLKKAGEIAT